jgi:hypothetical protein
MNPMGSPKPLTVKMGASPSMSDEFSEHGTILIGAHVYDSPTRAASHHSGDVYNRWRPSSRQWPRRRAGLVMPTFGGPIRRCQDQPWHSPIQVRVASNSLTVGYELDACSRRCR